jgi:hypothetical protein
VAIQQRVAWSSITRWILIVAWPADRTSVASAGSNWRSRSLDTTT